MVKAPQPSATMHASQTSDDLLLQVDFAWPLTKPSTPLALCTRTGTVRWELAVAEHADFGNAVSAGELTFNPRAGQGCA